jgi:Flp pilus assembly protein TadG
VDDGKGFLPDVQGNIALMFALLTPVIFGAAGAGLDFYRYSHALTSVQDAADGASLGSAREMLLASATAKLAEERARAIARSKVAETRFLSTAQISAKAVKSSGSIKVSIEAQFKPTVFVALFKNPIYVKADAEAVIKGSSSVCIIALEEDSGDAIYLDDHGAIRSTDCAVFSNSSEPTGIVAKSAAYLESDFICSAGGFDGDVRNYSNEPLRDCPLRADPLAQRAEPTTGACAHNDLVLKDFTGAIDPGVYCGGLIIDGASDVQFNPGIYVMRDGQFEVKDTSRATGVEVGVFFEGDNATALFDERAQITFGAPMAGEMAGVVLWRSREATGSGEFKIASNFVDELVGAVYLPTGELYVSATDEVGEDSAYTVIIAKRVRVDKRASLVLNNDYAASNVPGLDGMKDKISEIFLRE